MAKRKNKTSSVKKRTNITKKSKKQNNRNINIYPKLIFLVLAVVIFLFVLDLFLKNTDFNSGLISKRKNIVKSAEQVKSLITPYPTIFPKETPTPVPLSGYCLHVPVLMYHHIQPESVAAQLGQKALTVDSAYFDSQMSYLNEHGYTTLFANELINALITHQPLPEKSVVITMDDGYEDNFIYALPILQKYNIKANIMLASGLMGNSNMLSWDEVKNLKNSGRIYFTNHTWSHYPVTKQPQSKIESEIDIAQNQIQTNTGQTVNIFTYPYGQFNNNAVGTLQKKGYIGAFTEIQGQYQCDSFIMTLHRTRIGNAPLSSYGI